MRQISSSEVPKTTFNFNNLIENLKELTKSCYTHGYSLLALQDTDKNQPREEAHTAEFRNIPYSSTVFSPWNQGQHYFMASMCGNIHEIFQPGTPSPYGPFFTGLGKKIWLTYYKANSISSLLKVELIWHDPKPPQSHCWCDPNPHPKPHWHDPRTQSKWTHSYRHDVPGAWKLSPRT